MRIRTHNFLEVTAEDSVVDLDGARSALCLSHTSSTSCLYRRDLKKRKMIRFSGEGNCVRERNMKEAGLYGWESLQDCGESLWGTSTRNDRRNHG